MLWTGDIQLVAWNGRWHNPECSSLLVFWGEGICCSLPRHAWQKSAPTQPHTDCCSLNSQDSALCSTEDIAVFFLISFFSPSVNWLHRITVMTDRTVSSCLLMALGPSSPQAGHYRTVTDCPVRFWFPNWIWCCGGCVGRKGVASDISVDCAAYSLSSICCRDREKAKYWQNRSERHPAPRTIYIYFFVITTYINISKTRASFPDHHFSPASALS